MTFGENYFLIEACAADMTDKLAIVKEFSCGASLWAAALFVFQLNVLFALVSVFMLMFTQHSLAKLRNMTNTSSIVLQPCSDTTDAALAVQNRRLEIIFTLKLPSKIKIHIG